MAKIQPVSVALTPDERKFAKLEAACDYYRGLIELKLRQDGEIADDDPLVLSAIEAKNAFQEAMMPYLTV